MNFKWEYFADGWGAKIYSFDLRIKISEKGLFEGKAGDVLVSVTKTFREAQKMLLAYCAKELEAQTKYINEAISEMENE